MSLLQMSLYGGIFIIAAAAVRAVALDRLPKAAFLALWYVALFRLLLPVTFPAPSGVALFPQMTSRVPRLQEYLTSGDPAEGAPGNSMVGFSLGQPGGGKAEAAEAASISALLVLWIVGAAVMAVFFTVSYLRCRREFRTALPVRNESAARWLKRYPLRRTIDLRQLAGLSTPLVYGVFRPVIVMPKDTDWGNERQVQYILFHEYVHIRRFDGVGKLAAAAALCIHWFNPLVWVLYVLFSRDMELSCDESVVRHFGRKNRKSYAQTLICMEEQRNSLVSFGNYFSRNEAERRIKSIMKFQKKSVPAFVAAAVIVVLGAAALFAAAPKTADGKYGDVLRGEALFFYVSEEEAGQKKISQVPALFDPYDEYMKIWEFALADLDGDGKKEVIIHVSGAAGDMGGSLILHQQGNQVYGYKIGSRELTALKEDGTYSYSDPTGFVESGICSITAFNKTGYTVDKTTYSRGTYEGWDSFVVNHQPATEEEFLAADSEQNKKPDAAWYEFTDENIRRFYE